MTQNKQYVHAICCRPDAVGDVVSSGHVNTIECYAVLNFEVVISSSFRDIQTKSFRDGGGGGGGHRR